MLEDLSWLCFWQTKANREELDSLRRRVAELEVEPWGKKSLVRFRETENSEQYYFTVHAKNYEPLVRSEMYESRFAAENGARALKDVMACSDKGFDEGRLKHVGLTTD